MFSFDMLLTQYNGMFLGPIAKLMGHIIDWIYEFFSLMNIHNAALCIVLFTFLMRALMIPLNLKQQKASKLSSRMNPELMKIQEKYKGKKDEASMRKQQAETTAVYEKYGANPLSGCLPLLLTFPIMLALWRVISNIPAYIPAIKELYENIAVAMQGVDGYVDKLTGVLSNPSLLKMDDSGAVTINAIIDVMATFTKTGWEGLEAAFPSIVDIIKTNSEQIMHINSVFGIFSISETPNFTSISVIIPILAAGLQYYQGKQISSGQPMEGSNQASALTKGMNTFMPITTGIFCLTLPIGVGLYWIAGSVFAIVQQFCVNRHLDRIDIDQMIFENQERAIKKKQKRGIDVSAQIRDLERAKLRAAHEQERKEKEPEVENNKPPEKKTYQPADYKKPDTNYSADNIAAIANILKNREKGDK